MPPSTTTNAASPTPDRGGVQDILRDNSSVSPIGVDTVRIHIEDFAVDEPTDFRIYEQSDYATGETQSVPLWEESGGTVITGQRAVLNTEFFQATVRGVDFMSVQASLPKLLYGDNAHPVTTAEDAHRALRNLNTRLDDQGIQCSLRGRPLGRVDICRNVRTDTPLADLEPLLKRLRVPYLEPRDNGHDGVKWVSLQGGRSERELTLYNKSEEAGLSGPHVQRLEYRLQRKRVVQANLGSFTADDLAENLSTVRSAFHKIVRELFPSRPGGNKSKGSNGSPNGSGPHAGQGDPRITSDQIRSLLGQIRAEHGENCHVLSRAIWPLLLATCPNSERLVGALERAAASADGPTRGKYQVRRKAREARPFAQELDQELKTAGQQLRRLRAKLLS